MSNGYGNYNRGGGYNQQSNNQGGYQKSQYLPPAKKQFNLGEACDAYCVFYLSLMESLKEHSINPDDVKDYIGGWVSGLKIQSDRA